MTYTDAHVNVHIVWKLQCVRVCNAASEPSTLRCKPTHMPSGAPPGIASSTTKKRKQGVETHIRVYAYKVYTERELHTPAYNNKHVHMCIYIGTQKPTESIEQMEELTPWHVRKHEQQQPNWARTCVAFHGSLHAAKPVKPMKRLLVVAFSAVSWG